MGGLNSCGKGVEKVNKGVESYSRVNLSKAQKEVLELLTKEFKTPKEIAIKRGVSKTSTYKIIKKLRQKGFLTKSFTRGLNLVTGITPKKVESPKETKVIRLHGQQFRIEILSKSDLYKKISQASNIRIIEGNTVTLSRNSIIVSCNELKHFYGETADMAMVESLKYWTSFFIRLQERLNITIITANKAKIKQFNAHFARFDKELGEYIETKEYKVKVFGDDGKLWFLIDKSWNMDEAETVHSETAKDDMEKVISPFLNDLREEKWIKLSEISRYMANTTQQINEISHGLKSVVDYLRMGLVQEEKKPDNSQKKILSYIN